MVPDIKSLTREELESQFQAWGEPAPPGAHLVDWLYACRAANWDAMSNLPKALREKLRENFSLQILELARKQVEANQAHVAQRPRQFARVIELQPAVRQHGGAGIQQQAHGHARLHLEHLQEELLQAHVGAPVDGAQVVAVVEVAMVEELLAGARKARPVVAAHQPGERLLPVNGQAFQLLQKIPVQQRSGGHASPTPRKPGLGRL